MGRNVLLSVVLVLLTVTAGCGGSGGDPGTPTPEPDVAGAPSTDTPALTTAATTGGSSVASAYRGAVDTTAMGTMHERALRNAGSFTLSENTTIDTNLSDSTLGSSRVIEFDLETGAAYRFSDETLLEPTETYVTRGGTAYKRSQQYGVSYEEAPFPPDPARALNASDVAVLAKMNTTHGTELVDGRTLHVYTAESIDQVPGDFEDGLEENVSLTGFEFRMEVFEGGHVRYVAYALQYEGPVTTGAPEELNVTVERRFTGVGSTTVEPPAWLDDAREAVDGTGATETGGTRVLAYSGSSPEFYELVVEVPSTADGDVLFSDPSAAFGDASGARVGTIGRFRWPEAATNVTLTAEYDPGEVPDGYDESGVTVAYFDREKGRFVALEDVETNTEDDEVVADIPPEYNTGTFSVMHYRRYVDWLTGG